MMSPLLSWEQRQNLARNAMHAAIQTRFEIGAELEDPICPYAACEQLGVVVRFVDIDMEGIYLSQTMPRILLSAHRPLARRRFNCAHELGHHIFGHGATLDELRVNFETYDKHHPDEFLVDSFAGHLMMPVLGIRRAFSRRGVEAISAGPREIMAVAAQFGVGYETLLTQLAFVFEDIPASKRDHLLLAGTKFRRSVRAHATGREIVIVDRYFEASTLDVEVNHLIIAPEGAVTANCAVDQIGTSPFGRTFRAARRGIDQLSVPGTPWVVLVRVAPERFVGLARFRHLEEIE